MPYRTNLSQPSGKTDEFSLFSKLDKGIDDMEKGNEMPLDEAFKKISEMRNNRRYEGT